MAHIKIIADSASDIPQYLVDKYNIGYVPVCIVIDGKVYHDRYDLDGRLYLINGIWSLFTWYKLYRKNA